MISALFSKEDLRQIAAKGIDPKVIENQIENFKKGFPYINLDRPPSSATASRLSAYATPRSSPTTTTPTQKNTKFLSSSRHQGCQQDVQRTVRVYG
jgi:hypothetical protein